MRGRHLCRSTPTLRARVPRRVLPDLSHLGPGDPIPGISGNQQTRLIRRILRIRAAENFEPGAWSLGRHYRWISPVAVAWIAIICVLFLLPVSPKGIPGSPDFDWEVVNYAPITVGGALILFGGWYLLSAKNWFTGPVRETAADVPLAEIEYELRTH